MVLLDRELTLMRNEADNYLPDTCTIQTPTTTTGSDGGIVTSFANTYTNVACRIDPASASENEGIVSDAIQSVSEYDLNVAYDQDIQTDYRVVHSGNTYQVESVAEAHSWATLNRATLRRIN